MPAKNKVKIYGEQVFYHVYNRGYNKQEIFRDDQDYKTFLYLLKKYLEPGFQEIRFTDKGEQYFLEPNHVYNEVELLAFCLMPNHFHLLVFQETAEGMTKLLRRITTSYSTYFNTKYQLEGSPFQDIYKAVAVKTEGQLLHLSRYIHLNSTELLNQYFETYPYSSYQFYLSIEKPKWLKPDKILKSFTGPESYKKFVSDQLVEPENDILNEVILD